MDNKNKTDIDNDNVGSIDDSIDSAVDSIKRLDLEDKTQELGKTKRPMKKIITTIVVVIIVAVIVATVGAFIWYKDNIKPVDINNEKEQLVVIDKGESVESLAKDLDSKNLIRNRLAFRAYARINKLVIHAGPYELSKSMSVDDIADKIQQGDIDTFDLSLTPGLTVDGVRKALVNSGFDKAEVEKALSAKYSDIPVMASKPPNTSLEGYIMSYSDKFKANATATDVIRKAIETLNNYVDKEDLANEFKKHGLSLYQGITLASIIQKEGFKPDNMAHMAQVLYSRLDKGIPLGSDPTFIYAADILGVKATPDLDSPYNTRIHKGLPPTPISSPSKQALYAAAHPTNTDDLFFLAGDDGKMYFSKTNDQHEQLKDAHCHVKCQLP